MYYVKNDINNKKYKIDHIALYYIDQFLELNIQEGDLISFNACAYIYERKDKTISYGLRFYNNIKNIHNDKLWWYCSNIAIQHNQMYNI